jgi:5'-3' exonuclease
MDVYLIDGTYELFRHFFAVPSSKDTGGKEIGAVRGVLASVLSMIEKGATHLGVATDHVVESFRNDLYPGYKTSEVSLRSCYRNFLFWRKLSNPWG